MKIEQLLQKIESRGQGEALICQGHTYTFSDLAKKIAHHKSEFSPRCLKSGQVVALQSDYSLQSISILLALWSNQNIVVLIPMDSKNQDTLLAETQVEWIIRSKSKGEMHWEKRASQVNHPLLVALQKSHAPGFVIFSSGSTGKAKAILHDVERFLSKFETANKPLRTLVFLLFDHIAGLDTLFYILCSGGVIVIPEHRETAYICHLITEHSVEVLPTSPTFLNLLCLSHQNERYDLSSLKVITYGSEPMTPIILSRVQKMFPGVKIIQKYGLSELGSPRSESKKEDSLWIKITDHHYQSKVIDNILWIKSKSTMLGYLNVPVSSPSDGWFSTGDEVRVDGDWMKILGRKSDLIIVGGEKVYPSEVESVLLEMPNIKDVAVNGEAHPLMGNIVVAKVHLREPCEEKKMLKEIRAYCKNRLEAYKFPVKLEILDEAPVTHRHKKLRK